MIPVKDDNPRAAFPFVTILLILTNVGVFVYQAVVVTDSQAFVTRFGAIPWELVHFSELPNLPAPFRSEFPSFFTLFTAMFLHGGVLHLTGNMIYLWVFGDNVEGLMGHWRFFLFYILCGLVASLAHVVSDPSSTVPMIGASGALSGVLGAYFLRFPRAKVHVLIFLFIFIKVFRISAIFVLGFWFIMQVLNGFGWLGFQSGGGIAWFAHIGGFVTGAVLVYLFEKKGRIRIYRRSVL